MQIRKCAEADIASTGAFYDRVVLWLDGHVNYPKWIYGVYPSMETVEASAKAGTQFICLDDNGIIGAFILNDDPDGNYQKGSWQQALPDGEYMVLHTLAIDPEYHRQGIGSEIIRFCVDRTRSNGYKALRVDIVPDNLPARKLYEKNGFTYAGDVDLERGIEGIPVFSLFELNLCGKAGHLSGGVPEDGRG